MGYYRYSKDTTAHYTSLEEMRAAMNIAPASKRTKNKEKLAQQRERFLGKCKVCGQPLQYIEGTNVLSCKNPDCKGLKIKDDLIIPINKVLDSHSAEIAHALFD